MSRIGLSLRSFPQSSSFYLFVILLVRNSNSSFTDENGNDNMKQVIEANYRQVKADIVHIVESEMERLKNDPDLQHLIQNA